MSLKTIDDTIYALSNSVVVEKKPFHQKLWLKIDDTNANSSYTNTQLTWETSKINNSTGFMSLSEGYISIPMVAILKGVPTAGGVVDFTDANTKWTDYCMALKNCHTNVIHSVIIEYANQTKFSCSSYANHYLNFLLHSTLSEEDEALNGSVYGYAKDSSRAWGYNATPGIQGQGLYNNVNNASVESGLSKEGVMNEGLLRRQQFFLKSEDGNNKNRFLDPDDTRRLHDAANTIINTATQKVYYYDCIVPLRHLCPSIFDTIGLTKSADIRITLTLNAMVDFTFVKDASGNLSFEQSKFNNSNASLTNMWMVCASYNNVRNIEIPVQTTTVAAGQTAAIRGNGLPVFSAANTTTSEQYVACGSAALPCEATYTFSSRIVSNSGLTHKKTRCSLNIPVYQFNPQFSTDYLGAAGEKAAREINCLNIRYQSFTIQRGGDFRQLISSAVAYPKRLILVAHLAKNDDNAGVVAVAANPNANPPVAAVAAAPGFSTLSSPFATDCAHTIPFNIINFNVYIAGRTVYSNDNTNYTFKQYMSEMNGSTGVNSNQLPGVVSSRINFEDFNNNYHYLVVDLSRLGPTEVKGPHQIEVEGQITSPYDITFYSYLECKETWYIDHSTGAYQDGAK